METSQSIIQTLLQLNKLIPPDKKKRLVVVVAVVLAYVLVETVSVGVLAAFASVVSNPDQVFQFFQNNPYLNKLDLRMFATKGELILAISLASVVIVGIKNSLFLTSSYVQAATAASISCMFGKKFVRGLIGMPYSWHVRQNSSELMTVFYWREQIGNDFIRSFFGIIADVILILFLISTLIVANAKAFFLAILLSLIFFFSVVKFMRPIIDRVGRQTCDIYVNLSKHVGEVIHGIKDIKLLSGVFVENDINIGLESYARKQSLRYLLLNFISPFFEFLGILLLASIVLIMNFYFNDSPVKVTGTIALFAVVSWKLLPTFSRIASSFSLIRGSLPSISKVLGLIVLFESQGGARVPEAVIGADDLEKDIRIEDVGFSYGGSSGRALSNLSLSIKKGESIGVIGPSGAGKSTLIDIFIGLLDPDEGAIVIDGKPLSATDKFNWVRQIGYVPQTPYISDNTLLANIAFGLDPREIDLEMVNTCCEMAHIKDFLGRLPEGLHSLVGEKGMMLSGGQRQRIAIARALYRKPQILVLDEATSALDTRCEESIQETINGLHGKMTMLIIAHRLTTVERCDKVLWLDGGKMRMFGEAKAVIAEYMKQ